MPSSATPALLKTPLYPLHERLGARLVPFAGYAMPVQYPGGIIAEHGQCRTAAALFDVAHMGVIDLIGPDRAAALETAVPANVRGLAPGAMAYSFLTLPTGGIIDDFMISNLGDRLMLVVNAACKEADLAHLRQVLPDSAGIEPRPDLALIAMQGPQSEAILRPHAPEAAALRFMTAARLRVCGVDARVSRSGYTGEDGFEIALPADQAMSVAEQLLSSPGIGPAGLGARDSLRLEAGLCLYGHDIGVETSPVEAGLTWAIPPHRRGADAGYPGAAVIARQIAEGPARRRVGLRPSGRAPVREGADLVDADGRSVGTVTSGGFGPTVGAPISMAYLNTAHAHIGSTVDALVRGRPIPTVVARLPFVPRGYKR